MRKDVFKFIKEHEHINYCEALVYPDGTVAYAVPSHQKALIRATGEDESIIWEKIPIVSSPIDWLVEYTKCACIWTKFCIIPKNAPEPLINAVNALISNKLTDKIYITRLNEWETKTVEEARENNGEDIREFH